jgi:hypothetical protein
LATGEAKREPTRAKTDAIQDYLALGGQHDLSPLEAVMMIGYVHQHDGLVGVERCSPEDPHAF